MKHRPSARPCAVDRPEELAVVSLGSNLGDSRAVILTAMGRLQEWSDGPVIQSSLWQTSPVDCPPGSPPFVNAVAVLRPSVGLTADQLLDGLQALEKEFGRQRKKQLNEPRPLDLDIIWFLQEHRQDARLSLPHPRAHGRRFVLQPLAELLPEAVFPGQGKAVRSLLLDLDDREQVVRLND